MAVVIFMILGLSNPKSSYDQMIDDKAQEEFLRKINEKK